MYQNVLYEEARLRLALPLRTATRDEAPTADVASATANAYA
jgi:hypothetical protein